jgi:hypothetical protein
VALNYTDTQWREMAERNLGFATVWIIGPQTRDNTLRLTVAAAKTRASLKQMMWQADRWNSDDMLVHMFWHTETMDAAKALVLALDDAFVAEDLRDRKARWFRGDPLAMMLVIDQVAASVRGVFDEVTRERRVCREMDRLKSLMLV